MTALGQKGTKATKGDATKGDATKGDVHYLSTFGWKTTKGDVHYLSTFSLTDKYGNSYQKSVLLKGRVFATTLVSYGAGIVDYINCSVK